MSVKRVRMVVAYDGTNYHGWQIQNNGITVEEVLNKALSRLTGETVAVIGASRTDAGVHAQGNVAVFDTESPIPGDKISYAVNRLLPEDIRVLRSEEVAVDWNPRYVKGEKTYEYHIYRSPIPMPTRRLYSYHTYGSLNVEAMRRAAGFLVGEHDFASFCGAGAQVETTVREVTGIELVEEGPELIIRVKGMGFLYNMVRIMAGTLMDVGFGRRKPEDMVDILKACDRQKAGPTAPACGLTLIGYRYMEEE